MTRAYMTDDQRFASRRPDVLSYRSDVLEEDLTLAGPIEVELWVSTTGTAADWVVKLIDVFPSKTPEEAGTGRRPVGGYELMVGAQRGHPRPLP